MSGNVPTELGTKPINSLIRQYAVPGIIAMTASSLYNMVDSIYIGHIANVGSLSIAGLAVTFPLMKKVEVFGVNAHPIFKYLTEQVPTEEVQGFKDKATMALVDSLSRSEGRKEGEKKGLEKGHKEEKLDIARNMKQKGMDTKTIADITGLTAKEIKNL